MEPSTTEDLTAEYAEAVKPFGAPEYGLKSWRYFLEINSGCNLSCPMCTKGNKKGYDHENGFMDTELMEAILDKIRSENPNAVVFAYGNSEPFLNSKLPECIASIKRRGLRAEFASNLNYVQRLDDTLAARPDMIIISLSGFTQDIYIRGHAGGNVEKVKTNMKLMSEAVARNGHSSGIVYVNYHLYNDNDGDEKDRMKEYAESLGFTFFTSIARAISMENTLQYLRHLEQQRTGDPVPYRRGSEPKDWNALLPPVNSQFIENIGRLKISPADAVEMYGGYPILKVCPVGDSFTFIRHDGKTSLCACVADRRIILGDFLDTTQDELSASRRGHPICNQCLKYRMNLYFHNVTPKRMPQ